jgi:hypothetical protein
MNTIDRNTTGNSGFVLKRGQSLIEHSSSHQLLLCDNSFVHRNPPLRQAANHCSKPIGKQPIKFKK